MQLAPLYKPEHNLAFKSWVSGSKVYFALTEESSQKVSSTIDIITPSGKVDKISFDSDKIGSDGKLTSTKNAKFSYNMNESGVYLVEVNFDNGFAAIIEPVVYGNVLAILPNEYDFVNRDIETNASTAVKQTFDSINQVRKQAGLDALQIDPNLSKIAQFKAQDMSDNNYVGHVDSQGVFIRDTGKRIGVVITSSMGENVAGGTVSASFLQAGLSLSA